MGPTITHNAGIIGEGVDLDLAHIKDLRPSSLVMHLTARLVTTKLRDPGGAAAPCTVRPARALVREWLDSYLECQGGTYPAQLMYQELADMACERITSGDRH